MDKRTLPFTLPFPDELARVIDSSDIAYQLISEGFGISEDGIENIVEQLQSMLPQVTNGHVLTFLFGQLSAHSTAEVEKEFPVVSINREDLKRVLSEDVIAKLTDDDLVIIADKMNDYYFANGFWEDLEVAIEYLLELNQQIEEERRTPPKKDG